MLRNQWTMQRIRLASFLLLLSVLKVSADAKGQEFFCQTKAEREELDNSRIERLLIDKDVVYLFLPKKALYFKMPYFYSTFKTVVVSETITVPRPVNETQPLNGVRPSNSTMEIVQTRYLEMPDKNFLITGSAFALLGNWSTPDHDLIGYVSDNIGDKPTLFEFYRDAKNEIKHQALKFDPTPGVADGQKSLSEGIKTDFLKFTKEYRYYFQFNNKEARVGFTYYNDDTTFADLRTSGKSVKTFKKQLKRGNETITFGVYYEAPTSNPGSTERRFPLINSLIEVDRKNKLHIHFMALRRGQTYMHVDFKLSEFFGCRGMIDRKERFKGVFYDRKFYLFIAHHYIILDDDLVETGFAIENQAYENGIDLKFGKNYRFEDYSSKWVKSFRSTTYLSVLDRTSKISVDQSGNLAFTPVDERELKKLVENCTRQVLNVDKNLFCFEERSYYLVGSSDGPWTGRAKGDYVDIPPKYPIAELFEGGQASFGSNETVDFIFNYKADKFVIVTNVNLFILDYSTVQVKGGAKLIFPKDQVSVKKHHLYESIDKKQSETVTGLPTTANGPRLDSAKLMILIVIAVVATVLLLLHLTCTKYTKKKRPKKPNLIKLESRGVKVDSKSAKSSINFSKLMNESKTPKRSTSKDISESTNYSKQTTGKATTMHLNKFVNVPKNGEKSESSKVLYIDSQTGSVKMKDQKPPPPPPPPPALASVEAAKMATDPIGTNGVSQAKDGNVSNTSERRKSLQKNEAGASGRKKSLPADASPEEVNGQSKLGSNVESDGRLLTIESSNFESDKKESAPSKPESAQTRRGSTQSGGG